MKEKTYAFLMQRMNLDDEFYAFRPIGMVTGIIENYFEDRECFVTEDGSSYLYATDANSIDSGFDTVAYYIKTEKEISKEYPANNFSESLEQFANDTYNYLYLGYNSLEEDIIKMARYSLMEMVNGIDVVNSPEDYQHKTGVLLDKETFESLLSINDYDELKKALLEISDKVNELEQSVLEEKNADYIGNLFEKVYATLLESKDINEIKDWLNRAYESYIEMTYELEKYNIEDSEEAQNLLLESAEKYSKLLKLNDLNVIKEKIKKQKIQEEAKIGKWKENYNSNHTKEIQETGEIEIEENDREELLDVKNIKKYFDAKIIGQEEAKKDVISAIFMNKLMDSPSNKNNCLLVGPTGSGKTLIAETVAEYFNMPIQIIDTTQLTMPGYVGADVDDFLIDLLEKAGGNLEKAERGIVVFDEIDKKGSDSNSDVSGKGVLNTLLPFIGGTTYNIRYQNRNYTFDTSNLTIFATGAFTDLIDDKSNIYGNSKIGFSGIEEETKEDITYRKFGTEDFVKKGNMPAELIGRFSAITQLSGHTIESLRKILIESTLSPLLIEQQKLCKINVNLIWTDEYIDEVAKQALKLKTGARSLKSIVEKSIKAARWEVLNNLDIYTTIKLTKDSALDNTQVTLIDLYDYEYNLKDILEAKDKTSIKVYKKEW